MTFEAFHALSLPELRALAQSLRDGALSHGTGLIPLQQIAGARAPAIAIAIAGLRRQGLTGAHVGLLVAAMVETREHIPDPSLVFDLVLSGPALQDIPTRHTGAVVQSLFAMAEGEVLVAGYAIHQGSEIFAKLHERMLEVPGLATRLFFNISRRQDTPTPELAVQAFAKEFVVKHWPWSELPQIYYFPQSLEAAPLQRASLHAKCVIVDGRIALVTSANFTAFAHQRNIEAGVLIRHKPMVDRLRGYFHGLVGTGKLKPVDL